MACYSARSWSQWESMSPVTARTLHLMMMPEQPGHNLSMPFPAGSPLGTGEPRLDQTPGPDSWPGSGRPRELQSCGNSCLEFLLVFLPSPWQPHALGYPGVEPWENVSDRHTQRHGVRQRCETRAWWDIHRGCQGQAEGEGQLLTQEAHPAAGLVSRKCLLPLGFQAEEFPGLCPLSSQENHPGPRVP